MTGALLGTTANLVRLTQESLTEDLRRKQWRNNANPLAGQCYVASESLYHLCGGKASGLTVCRVRHEGSTRWFLTDKQGGVLDPTAGQFDTAPPYAEATRTGFLTSRPSKRAAVVIERVKAKL